MAAPLYGTKFAGSYDTFRKATGDTVPIPFPVINIDFDPRYKGTRIDVSPENAIFSLGEQVLVKTADSQFTGRIIVLPIWSRAFGTIILDKDYTNGIHYDTGTIEKYSSPASSGTAKYLFYIAIAGLAGFLIFRTFKKK